MDIKGATSVVNSAKALIDAGPASALSSVSNAIGGAVNSISSFLSSIGNPNNIKLPLPNPLSAYATYDYVLGIGVLTKFDINNPDTTYRAGKRVPLVAKSANADPSNRIQTPYGKFDFFIDNLVLNSTIGFEKGNNTNVTTLSFDITEPYSMGLFLIAIQTAAQNAGWDNYRECPFLLTIDFRGNKESGIMEKVPNTSRQIPFLFASYSMNMSQMGAKYSCTCNAHNGPALASKTSELKSDTSIKGATVQEVLQTGEKSLQAVVNQRLQQYKKDKIVNVPDEVLILFPNEIASESAPQNDTAQTEKKSTATTSTKAAPSDIMKKLGVAYSDVNKTLIQPDGQCNAIGRASMGYSIDRKGDTPVSNDNAVYNAKTKVYTRGDNTSPVNVGNFKFSQNTDIPTAINQVLMASQYANLALDAANLTKTGMRKWWRIDTQVYVLESKANLKQTGKSPRLIVYRVIPYETHSSRLAAPNVKAPGFDELKKQAVKHYNYLYTGKNTEVLKFDIEFKASIDALMTADSLKRSQDVVTESQTGSNISQEAEKQPLGKGNNPSKEPGTHATTVSYTNTSTGSDKRGGGPDDYASRAAKVFHDAITYGSDMITLNMDIMGDPYYVAQSGQGNYTSKPETSNLNKDGSVNWQSGEVDIIVNFRTPIDINQSTGLYNFGGQSKSAPVIGFSGLYYVNGIVSNFRGGRFTQTLSGARRIQQELKEEGTKEQVLNVSTPQPAAAKDTPKKTPTPKPSTKPATKQ
jgi:hypothetical protein